MMWNAFSPVSKVPYSIAISSIFKILKFEASYEINAISLSQFLENQINKEDQILPKYNETWHTLPFIFFKVY